MKGLRIPINHKFSDIFNKKLQQLFEGGLTSRDDINKDYTMSQKFYSDYNPELYYDGPEVLTLEHLEAGFVIWLCCIVISIISFIIERVVSKVVSTNLKPN